MRARTDRNVDILLVDDREDGLIALEALLGDNPDYTLVKAQTGREAIGLLDLYDFGVILMDVQMPELDGFETAEIIRRQPRYQSIPILFVTAINKDDRYIYRGYEAGAVDYIFKPFDPMVLRSKVSVFADLHVKTRRLALQAKQLAERDALEHRANMQSLELDSLRRYRNLADAIPHMVLRATPRGEMEYHNELWSNYTGMNLEESMGSAWQEAIHPMDRPLVLKIWNRSILKGEPYEVECRIRRHDGTYRWHWVKADNEKDTSGNIIAWLGTCTDIHDRKAAEEELKEAQKRAESANDAKTHFLANMSHEIRTPLNAIMGFTELLLDPSISMEEKLKSVAIVRRNGHALLKIVDEILDISKVEAGGLQTEKVETRVVDLIQEIKALMLIQAGKRKIDLVFTRSSRVPDVVITDSTRVRQILINIVGNAIKFTDKGSVKVSTRFITNMDGRSFLQFQVTDTGLGIGPESAEKIFRPFSQADTSTTRIYGGTGLGLPLARKLARALGGDVRLTSSEPGKGSSFTIEIEVEVPIRSEWISQVDADESEPPSAAASTSVLNGKRILLVEDAEDNQFLITQFLSRTGAIVDIANNGREGVTKALANNYEVVLMDIQMPFVDGYEATTQLRAAGYKTPIIALTAHALNEERDKCLRTGCNSHLTKPINRQQLIDSLVHYVSNVAPARGPDTALAAAGPSA
jgi:PAS domain S-box-containing protein